MIEQDELHQKKRLLESELKRYEVALKYQKNVITDEIRDFKNKVKSKVEDSAEILGKAKYVAMALGAIWVIYKLLSIFFGESKDVTVNRIADKNSDSSVVVLEKRDSGIIRRIKDGIVAFVLAFAKEELSKIMNRFSSDFTGFGVNKK